MSERKLLRDKVCLITGTSSGIGKAIAEQYAREGAVVYANSLLQESIDEWAEECSTKYNTEVIPVYFDVRDIDTTKKYVMQMKKQYSRIDVLVNNAGIVTYEMLNLIDFNKLSDMFDINVISVIRLVQLISRIMGRNKSGSIINISSLVSVQGVEGQIAYSATKGAINSLTLSAAKELASKNIRVNAIAPGMIGTERLLKVIDDKFQNNKASARMGRLGTPGDIAELCVFLGSDSSSYITGQIIGVDGSLMI